MKKTLGLIALAVLVMLAGCKKNEPQTTGTKLIAGIEQQKNNSKTSLDGLQIKWSENDELYVNNGTAEALFTLSSGAGTTKGEFFTEDEYPFSDNNVAVYPYDNVNSISGTTVTMTLPADQSASASGTFGNGANPMLGTFTDFDNLQLTSLCGVLCLQLWSATDVAITAIEIEGGAEDKLSGRFKVNDYTNPALNYLENGSNKVTLNFTETVTLTATPQSFYVVLPPVTLHGFTMKVYYGTNVIFTKSTTTSFTAFDIVANRIDSMNPVEVVPFNPLTTPLTFQANADGVSVGVNNAFGINLQYSTDGVNWNDYSSAITLTHAGDIVSFRGNNTSFNYYNNFTCSGNCYIYGNVMSLLHAGDYATNYALSEYALIYLFSENINIDIHPYKDLVLPATQLEEYCYAFMFDGCTGLTKAPALPAETMANYCYARMFEGCEGLQTAPELPATTLATNCYQSMFSNCTGLTVAPELNATNLAQGCYAYMFSGCTSLNTVPNLPATVLADGCYGRMFYGCTGLTTAPTLPVTTLAEGCYASMFEDCSNLTTAPALPATTLAEECYAFMFSGCTKLTTAPELPATTLVDGCYYYMFNGCTSLNSITCLATSGFGSLECTEEWVTDVASTGTFYADPAATWSTGTDGIPTDWTRKNPDGSDWVAPAPVHEYVDLGLPSGTLWATCNIGADNPEDYGDYFAWGETTTKTTYYWNNYQYCNGSYNTLTKYCNTDDLTTLQPEDDAATANWGSDWRMPTKADFEELYSNTTVTWTQRGGVNGRLFTAANSNSLFLPAAGYRDGGSLNSTGSNGSYWSSSLYTDNRNNAWYFNFYSNENGVTNYYRSRGRSVRAVRSAPQN